jgi:hypothetical protein
MKVAQLRLAVRRGRWDLLRVAMNDEGDPSLILRVLLGSARDPEASAAEHVEAYRTLMRVFEGSLKDPEFARAVHREWLDLSLRNINAHGAYGGLFAGGR